MIDPRSMLARMDFSLHPRVPVFVPKAGQETYQIYEANGWTETIIQSRRKARGVFPFYFGCIFKDEMPSILEGDAPLVIYGAVGVRHDEDNLRSRCIIGFPELGFDPEPFMVTLAKTLTDFFRDEDRARNQL